jgi:UDP-N-acetylglucosamine:LPS N-acetylglucosamine transferase
MKTTISSGSVLTHLLVGAVVIFLASAATAGETKKPAKARADKAVAASTASAPTEKVELTGSRIPRKVRKSAHPRDVDMTVAIIDRKQIDLLGGGSLTETLRKSPMIR